MSGIRVVSGVGAALLALSAAGCGGTTSRVVTAADTAAAPGATVTAGATPTGADVASTSRCSELTTATTAGPFYVTGTAQLTGGRLNVDALPGDPIRISGFVYRGAGTDAPLAGAIVDVWQADGSGTYWPAGNGPASRYTAAQLSLRGHVATDTKGFYSFTTIFPGEYEGRARHIHVRATSADGAHDVVTQLIMSKDGDRTPAADDAIARSLPACHTMVFTDGEDVPAAAFDFHLP